jgi:hypothetical protein
MEIAAAPEVAALLPLADGHVLVVRYWSCPGERIIPLNLNARIPVAAGARFQRDVRTLAALGVSHPMTMRSGAWSAGDKSGTIVLWPWTHLSTIESNEERDEMFAYVDGVCALRSI